MFYIQYKNLSLYILYYVIEYNLNLVIVRSGTLMFTLNNLAYIKRRVARIFMPITLYKYLSITEYFISI